ncbi:hypothetical protein [Pseudomonas chlororaphis]
MAIPQDKKHIWYFAGCIFLMLTGCGDVRDEIVLQQTDTYKVVCQKDGTPWGLVDYGNGIFSGPVAMKDGHPFIFPLGGAAGSRFFNEPNVRSATCDEARQPLYFKPTRPPQQPTLSN